MSKIQRLKYRIQNFWASVNESPILVLGNQKSGTSAITHLLADYAGLSKTVDIPPLWGQKGIAVMRGEVSFRSVVQRHPAYFARAVLKEPMMTFFASQVLARFPKAHYVFIVRDPRSNIRSLLNSRNIPGDLNTLSEHHQPDSSAHRVVADPEVWGNAGKNYIGVLAHRWNRAVSTYFEHENCMTLVKFEDFLDGKYSCIARLADELGLEEKQDIRDRLDYQYQPRGNRSVSWKEFFGQENLHQIDQICLDGMKRLSYPPMDQE